MKAAKLFWITALVAIILGASVYFSSKKSHNSSSGLGSAATIVVDAPKESPLPQIEGSTPNPQPTACTTQHEFLEIRRELGLMVNRNHEIRQKKTAEFLRLTNQFRSRFGLPFPLVVTSDKAEEQGVVYNNCKPACRGTVNVVFVSRLVGQNQIEVLTKNGTLKKIPLRESGMDVATIDELNRKGVPFRTWRAPVSSEWSMEGNNLYIPMDIENLWLKVDTRSHWKVVSSPKGLVKLHAVEPAVKVAGCHSDDHCLELEGAKNRHFKAPRFCDQVVRHAEDEPAEHPAQTPNPYGGP